MSVVRSVWVCWCSPRAAVCLPWTCVWIMLRPVIDGKVNHSRQMVCAPKSALGGVTVCVCVCMYVYECMDVCLSCNEWVWDQPSQASGQPAVRALSSSSVTWDSSWASSDSIHCKHAKVRSVKPRFPWVTPLREQVLSTNLIRLFVQTGETVPPTEISDETANKNAAVQAGRDIKYLYKQL